ncbi:hypothetical protein K7G98_07955 [Saccharothrix sp. MB29]|nr:hypothetical protein [Saccharothrix sp. MB29]
MRNLCRTASAASAAGSARSRHARPAPALPRRRRRAAHQRVRPPPRHAERHVPQPGRLAHLGGLGVAGLGGGELPDGLQRRAAHLPDGHDLQR